MKLILFCLVFFAATFAVNAFKLCKEEHHKGLFGSLRDKFCQFIHPKPHEQIPPPPQRDEGLEKLPPSIVENENDKKPKQTRGEDDEDEVNEAADSKVALPRTKDVPQYDLNDDENGKPSKPQGKSDKESSGRKGGKGTKQGDDEYEDN